MITSGIDRISISVGDMDESLAFYSDWVGMKVVADQTLEHKVIQKLWDLPMGTSARTVFLKKDGQTTLLELIQFQPHSGKRIREGANPWDYGLDDICFMVKRLMTA